MIPITKKFLPLFPDTASKKLYFFHVDAVATVVGTGVGPVHLDSVQCSRSEQRLIDCPATRVVQDDGLYDHTGDVGVACRNAGKE